MKTNEINIRDPFILCSNHRYYLYGTRSATTWGLAEGFDCYESSDLMDWEGPFEIFHRQEDFPFDRAFWAPECYEIGGKYYLITTLGSETKKKSVYALVSESPKGPFLMHSEGSLSPKGWCSIDGSLYFERDGRILLIFSHSFEDVPTGDMVAVELSKDLKKAVSEPRVLFDAVAAPWSKPVPFAKAEFGMEGDVYFTDGPCAHRMDDDRLMIIWSSWSDQGYAVGVAVSEDGTMDGTWRHQKETVYPGNGGHGMIFKTYEGKLKYTMHYPNDLFQERPCFFDVAETEKGLRLI